MNAKIGRLGFLIVVTAAFAQPSTREVQEIHLRDFHSQGLVKKEAASQDAVQRICTITRDKPPGDVARELEADQMKTIVFPSGSLLGNWKNGEIIAQSVAA